jgi:hypothetical protein
VDAQAPWAEPFLACGSHARCTQQAAGVGSQPSCSSTLWALHANPHRAAPVPAVPAVPAVLKVGNSAFADEFNELVPDTWAIINGERHATGCQLQQQYRGTISTAPHHSVWPPFVLLVVSPLGHLSVPGRSRRPTFRAVTYLPALQARTPCPGYQRWVGGGGMQHPRPNATHTAGGWGVLSSTAF